jgi:hypothetical protein
MPYALRPYDNIPILSFLILRGRCRSVEKQFRFVIRSSKASPRYSLLGSHCMTEHRFALPFDLAFVACIARADFH